MLYLPRRFADEMIAHAREDYPYEVCGLLAGNDSRVAHVYRTTNSEKSETRYFMEPREQLRFMQDMDEKGLDLLAIYHSHPKTQAYPSATDVSLAYYPDSLYVILTLMDPQLPQIRAFTIIDEQIEEQEIVLEK